MDITNDDECNYIYYVVVVVGCILAREDFEKFDESFPPAPCFLFVCLFWGRSGDHQFHSFGQNLSSGRAS